MAEARIIEIETNEIEKNHYKEKQPKETIAKAWCILSNLEFSVREESKITSVGTYSHHLFLRNNNSNVNIGISGGKGVTSEFARASAYGEMMERLQGNPRHLYRNYYDLYNKDILGIEGFVSDPNEIKEFNIDKVLKNSLFASRVKRLNHKSHYDNYFTYLNDVKNTYGYIPLQRYVHINSEGIESEVLIEEHTIRSLIGGTTGLSAGNTKYEALNQGISEIIERYIKLKAFKSKKCYPIISEEYLKNFKHAYEIYKLINLNPRFKLEIRDLSHNGVFPVVASILYDKEKRGYIVNFGVFPVFEIALNRTINELLQGHEIENVTSIKQFKSHNFNRYIFYKDCEKENDYRQYINNNQNNEGTFPSKFLSYDFDYDFAKWGCDYGKTNKDMFMDMVNLIEEKVGDKVYYKDKTFLDFPAYSIICPNMLYFDHYDNDEYYFELRIKKESLIEIFSDIDKKDFFLNLEKYLKNLAATISLTFILSKPLLYGVRDSNIIMGVIEYSKGNYLEASKTILSSCPKINDILKRLKPQYAFKEIDKWNCLSNYLAMLEELGNTKENIEQIQLILTNIYSERTVKNVIYYSSTAKTLLKSMIFDENGYFNIIDWEKEKQSIEGFKKIYNAIKLGGIN